MPLDDDTIVRIRQAQTTFAQRIKEIRADERLSDKGKQERMAQERAKTLAKVEDLKARGNAAYSKRVTELERALFGIRDIPSDITAAISYRDAQDRAAQISSAADAESMMRRAIRNGDQLLARALFDHAWESCDNQLTGSRWGGIVLAYLEEVRPDMRDAAEELAHLKEYNSRERRLGEQIESSVIKPPEMAGMSPYDERLAADEAARQEATA